VDRLIRKSGEIIPEEWKSARALRPHHRAQMGVYFLLIEDQLKRRPAYGVIVCGNGTRHRIDNDEPLRVWVLELAGRIRAARTEVTRTIPVNPRPGQRPPGPLPPYFPAWLPGAGCGGRESYCGCAKSAN
jgi:CRISPR-associated exonuclease Cas4